MVILLTGDNTFAIHDVVDGQVKKAHTTLGADAVSIVDAAELSVADLPQLLLGASLFATERLVVIRDAAANKQVWEKLEELLPSVDEQTIVILVASSADKRTRTYKWLQKNAEVRETKELSENDLTKWLQAGIKQDGADIKPDVARFLINYVGPDQWRLKQEAEKLALAGKPINQDLIRELIEPNPSASVFELLDAVFAGRTDDANKLLELIKGSEDPYRFFGLLANQIHALLLVAAASSRTPEAVAKDAGVHPFVIRKLQSVARRLDTYQRQQVIEIMANLDRQMKSTGADPWTLIQVGLSALATLPGSQR